MRSPPASSVPLNTFRSYRAKLVGIPMEEDGIDTQKLEEALNREKNVKYLYTIPQLPEPLRHHHEPGEAQESL